MKAVNLIPGEDRASRAAKAVGTGPIVYVFLGGLAGLVALAALWAIAGKQLGESRATLDRVSVEAKVAEARIAKAAPYQAFAVLARDRVATVTSLSETRFDWAHGLREISRVLPADVWLTALTGTSGSNSEAPTPTTSAAPAPTFELLGCTGNQAKVARLMARLRAVDGVREVNLRTSSKPDGIGAEDCPANALSNPRFFIAIAFSVPGSANAKVDATGAVADPAAAASAPAPGGATPAPAPSTTSNSSER